MKPVIMLYGNCQAGTLTTMARAIRSFQDRFTFKHIAWYVDETIDWAGAYGPDFMSDIRVVWEQADAGPVDQNRAEMRRRLPEGCQIIRFPPLWITTLWPFIGSDPRLTDSKRYFWTDTIAVQLVGADLSDDELYAQYMRISTERMPDLDRRLRRDLARWRANDEASDIKLADYVLEGFRKTRLFYTAAHVSAVPLHHILRALIDRTEVINPTEGLGASLELNVLLRHHEGDDYEMVPVHPLVAERVGLDYYDPNERHRYYGHRWTHKEYILNYIHWAPYIGGIA